MKNLSHKISRSLLVGLFVALGATSVHSAPLIDQSSPSCPFIPRFIDYPSGLQPNHVSIAAMTSSVSQLYVRWYNQFVTTSGAGAGIRVNCGTINGVANCTVSEGIGYGMLIAVLMGDKPLFDGLNTYYLAHKNGAGVMNWLIDSGGATSGANGATDADQDVAFALFQAGVQWGGTYNAQGVTVCMNMINSGCYNGNRVLGGDQNQGAIYPDYCAPGWYRCFATKDSARATNWNSITTWVYSASGLNSTGRWTFGFVPNKTDTSFNPLALAPETVATNHGYDASRWGWRMGLDYLWNGATIGPMQLFANRIYTGVNANGFGNYIQEYWNITNGNVTGQTGPGVGSPCSSLQIGPALVGCMAGLAVNAQNQDFINAMYDEFIYNRLWSAGCTVKAYFEETLSLECLLAATGKFPNMACNNCTTGTLTPPPPQPCFMLDDLEDANLNNATNGYWFTFAYASQNNTPVNPTPTRSLASNAAYIMNGPGQGANGTSYSARVTGMWQDNGPNIYGGFALATELYPGYRSLTGAVSLTQISFYIRATAPMTIRLNFHNPAIDPASGGTCTGGGWANQYGANVFVTAANTWQPVTISRYGINCQDWGGTGNCAPVCNNPNTIPPNTNVTLTRDIALGNVDSIQWLTSGNPTSNIGFQVDQVCLAFNRGATIPPTATPSAGGGTPTFTRTMTRTNTPVPPTSTSTATLTRTNTPLAATFTSTLTRTSTPIPATNTSTSTLTMTRTNTPLANTATSTSTQTRTNTPIPPTFTSTQTRTNTPVPPTSTSTNTPVPATFTSTLTRTSTPVPATFTSTLTRTSTPVPPTFTNTPVPATSTSTLTRTSTPVPPTFTSTLTRTSTAVPPTFTNTPVPPTFTSTRTSTSTPAPPTFTATSTNTGANTATGTSTPTRTSTPLPPTLTSTVTSTLTRTMTPVPPTLTSTLTRTSTPVPPTLTSTLTRTSTPVPPTFTSTPTMTISPTPTDTGAPTATSTFTSTRTSTPLPPTLTSTRTATPVPPTSTNTPVPATFTSTLTRTSTPVPPTLTSTLTRTSTAVPPTQTSTATSTSTPTMTISPTPTDTGAPTATRTGTSTSTSTLPPTLTNTVTSTATLTISPTATDTGAPTATRTSTATLTSTLVSTPTRTATATLTTTLSSTPTATLSSTPSRTATATATETSTDTFVNTPTSTSTGTQTFTPTSTLTLTASPTMTSSRTFTTTSTPTATLTVTPTLTQTSTLTPLFTATSTFTITLTPTATVQPGTTPIVFPNPITNGMVEILPQAYTVTQNVTVQIYSNTMRLVATKVFPMVIAGTTVKMELLDDTGEPLANGVYYIYVTVNNTRKSTTLVVTR